MTSPRNPKQEGTRMWDCRPQTGPCPIDCNQCFYNRPGAYYQDINEPYLPDPGEVGDDIVRINCGHDSNIRKEEVIEVSKEYKNFFFNTSIPDLDFPGPVVLTINPREEDPWTWSRPRSLFRREDIDRLMYVRIRVSPSHMNLFNVGEFVKKWARLGVPVVLTFMAYYNQTPPCCIPVSDTEYGWAPEFPDARWDGSLKEDGHGRKYAFIAYKRKVRHINSYFCATSEFQSYVLQDAKKRAGRLATVCGTVDSNYCRDCLNCQTLYWVTVKHLKDMDAIQ